MCELNIIEERDELEMLEQKIPIPFDLEPDIDFFVNVMREICPERFKSGEIVYHYTKSAVLEKLMADDGDILCGNYKNMNDDAEWDLGVQYILDYIDRKKWREEMVCPFMEIVEMFHSRNPLFVASFTAHEDKVSMWGMYTDRKDGGYAVGVQRRELERLCVCNNQRNALSKLYFLPCVYLGEDDVDAVIDRVVGNHADELEGMARQDILETGELLARRLLFLSCLIKDGSFDYENEWRLILFPLDSEVLSQAKVFTSNAGDKMMIFSGLFGVDNPIRDSIKKIKVSPHGDVAVLYKKGLGTRDQFDLRFDIDFSNSGYNGR